MSNRMSNSLSGLFEKKFETKEGMKFHEKKIHKRVIHKCDLCNREFGYKSKVKEHIMNYHEITEQKCNQ